MHRVHGNYIFSPPPARHGHIAVVIAPTSASTSTAVFDQGHAQSLYLSYLARTEVIQVESRSWLHRLYIAIYVFNDGLKYFPTPAIACGIQSDRFKLQSERVAFLFVFAAIGLGLEWTEKLIILLLFASRPGPTSTLGACSRKSRPNAVLCSPTLMTPR